MTKSQATQAIAKSEFITIRVTEKDKKNFIGYCRLHGVTPQAIIRRLIYDLGKLMEDREVNNVNQSFTSD